MLLPRRFAGGNSFNGIRSVAKGQGVMPLPIVDWVDFYGQLALLGRTACFI